MGLNSGLYLAFSKLQNKMHTILDVVIGVWACIHHEQEVGVDGTDENK